MVQVNCCPLRHCITVAKIIGRQGPHNRSRAICTVLLSISQPIQRRLSFLQAVGTVPKPKYG